MAVICGIDISSSTLEARIGAAGVVGSFSNTEAGVKLLAVFCRDHGVTLAAMEATGGYERMPYRMLWLHGVAAAVVHPHAVRCFAQAMGMLEKTDRLDAGLIAAYAAARGIVAVQPPSPQQQQLRALVTRLRQLTELQAGQKNQMRLVTETAVRQGFDQILALLKQPMRELEQADRQPVGCRSAVERTGPQLPPDQGRCQAHRGQADGRVTGDRHPQP